MVHFNMLLTDARSSTTPVKGPNLPSFSTFWALGRHCLWSPQPSWITVTVDATCSKSVRRIGLGVVVQDSNSRLLDSVGMIDRFCSLLQAKARAI